MRIQCPHCLEIHEVNNEAVGQKVLCPKCSNPFLIPLPEGICPHGNVVRISDVKLSDKTVCELVKQEVNARSKLLLKFALIIIIPILILIIGSIILSFTR